MKNSNFRRFGIVIVIAIAVVIAIVIISAIGIATLSYIGTPTPNPSVLQIPVSTSLVNSARELSNNPIPLPKFINQVVNRLPVNPTNHPNYDLCAFIRTPVVWVPGNYDYDASNVIKKTLVMSINGHTIDNPVIEFSDIIGPMPDIRGTKTGSVSAGTSACVDVTVMANGFYTASIQFAGTDGKQYSYTWAFEIDR